MRLDSIQSFLRTSGLPKPPPGYERVKPLYDSWDVWSYFRTVRVFEPKDCPVKLCAVSLQFAQDRGQGLEVVITAGKEISKIQNI